MEYISDMYMAATLLAYGADLLEVDRSNPSRQRFKFGGEVEQVFVIEPGTKVPLRVENPTFDAVLTYYTSQKLIFPPSFVDALRRMKALIHNN
jgi:hypothetical protein